MYLENICLRYLILQIRLNKEFSYEFHNISFKFELRVYSRKMHKFCRTYDRENYSIVTKIWQIPLDIAKYNILLAIFEFFFSKRKLLITINRQGFRISFFLLVKRANVSTHSILPDTSTNTLEKKQFEQPSLRVVFE